MAESDVQDMDMALDAPMKPVSTDVLKNILTSKTLTEDDPAVTARCHTPRASVDSNAAASASELIGMKLLGVVH